MDKVIHYREIVRNVPQSLADRTFVNVNAVNEMVFDSERDRYLVVTVGWEGNAKRVYSCLAHLDIIEGKVWIQRDRTEDGIGHALQTAGIPPMDIVPAFHPANVREEAGYAVA